MGSQYCCRLNQLSVNSVDFIIPIESHVIKIKYDDGDKKNTKVYFVTLLFQLQTAIVMADNDFCKFTGTRVIF